VKEQQTVEKIHKKIFYRSTRYRVYEIFGQHIPPDRCRKNNDWDNDPYD